MKYKMPVLVFILMVSVSLSFCQYTPFIKVKKLNDTLYKLTSTYDYDVNLVASIGPDGILLVDTGLKPTSQKLRETLDSLGDGPKKHLGNRNPARYEKRKMSIKLKWL